MSTSTSAGERRGVSPTPAPGDIDLDALVARAQQRAEDLYASGGWSVAEDAALDARFAEAAADALRVPALAESATSLRQLARRVVPPAARPLVWRGVRLVDALVRELFARLDRSFQHRARR